MNSLSNIIKKYAAFEAEVRSYTTKIYRDHCSACQGMCCKPEFCEESLGSPFLDYVRRRFAPHVVYDAAHGWLTPAGCALPVGRPPVCYQFFCDTILDTQSSAQSRYAIAVLSNLVGHIGKRAAGHKHIVELEYSSELARINLHRFEKQINEAASAFNRVRAYLEGQIAEFSLSPALMKISAAPAALSSKRSGRSPVSIY
jgi:hypothetical protein